MKPGLESMMQAAPSLPVQAECLRCHMSAVQHKSIATVGCPFSIRALPARVAMEMRDSTSQPAARRWWLALLSSMPGCGFCLPQLSLGGRYLGRARGTFGAGRQGGRFHLGLPGLLRLQRPGCNQARCERSGAVESKHVQANKR